MLGRRREKTVANSELLRPIAIAALATYFRSARAPRTIECAEFGILGITEEDTLWLRLRLLQWLVPSLKTPTQTIPR
jgi:hypothetical protein